MKTLSLSLVMFASFALYGQETIDLGEDVMNTFDSPGTECYELTIEEAGDYLLTYNLMNVTIKVISGGQELFSDYMANFATAPKEETITFQNTGTCQICFSTTGTMSVYQCRIVKADNSGLGESISLQYGEYVVKEISADNSPINYSFMGKTNDKIRIGISGMFMANLKITSPSKTVIFNQSYDMPPSDGLKLDFNLEETGEYLITVTPGWSFLQYSLSLYLLEPVQASFIKFNELDGGVLVNFGVDYYRFFAYVGDTLSITYTGSTEYISIHVITPGDQTIICNDIIDASHLEHTLAIEEEGEYVIVINHDMQGFLGYGLNVEMKPEAYELGTLIIREMAHLYKKVYSFSAGQDDILRIGLDLPSKVLELRDPGGDIILRMDSTASDNTKTLTFQEITLESMGEYTITIWHDFTGYSPLAMKFCASLVPEPVKIEKNNSYPIAVPPYHRFPYTFDADDNHVLRLVFPENSIMVSPSNDVITVKTGKTHRVEHSGTFTISVLNYLTDVAETEVLVKTIVPPESAVSVDIGQLFEDTIEFYEAPSIVYYGLADDTVFVQAEIKELILSPDVSNIINTPGWLYITKPSGSLIRIEGKPTGRISENGYIITYSFKKKFILDMDGNYFMTVCMDKGVTINPTHVTMRIDREGEEIEVPFGAYSDYEVPGIYTCSVPAGLDQLYVIVKKSNQRGYDGTWRGNVILKHVEQTWQSIEEYSGGRDDFIFQISQPGSGLYLLPVYSEVFNSETRGSILFTDKLPEAKVNGWSSGVITRPYGSDWKVLETNEAMDTLYFESEGYGMWSKIYIAHNSISNPDERWVFDNWGEGYNIVGKIPNAPAGRYYIRYVDSAVLYEDDYNSNNYSEDQSRVYMLYAGAVWAENSGLLCLRDASTHELGRGDASLRLYGSGLSSVSLVNLISEDEQRTIFMNILEVSSDGRELVAGYNFSGVTPGNYRLEVESPDTLIRYNKNIKILSSVTSTIRSSMLTSDLYRVGREQKCIIRVKNNGTTDIPYIAGYFYTTSELMRILITDTPESDCDAGLLNEALQDAVFTEMPFFIENLRVGDEAVFIYNIYSSSIPADEDFKVGYKVGVISETDYFALQEPMATSWYQFLISSESAPDAMKTYLEEITLNGFIDIWNHNTNTNLKKSGGTQSNKSRIENGTNKFVTVLDILPGKLPFAVPYQIAKEGVDVISEKGKECANNLERLNEYLKSINDNPFDEEDKNKKPVNSSTPEDKYGPVGYGMDYGNGYIGDRDLFEYRIDYWNKEDATAPAAIVYIRDTIDSNFDLKTLRFTEIGFLKWNLKLDGGQYFNVNIDCRPDMPYIVKVEGKVDYESREVYWVHTTLDPATMELPDDPMAGYLPPIDSTGYQMGWVNFTIRPEAQLPHGTSFKNQAFVNFDGVGPWGPAPPYGPYTNVFDFAPPWSYMGTLDVIQTGLTFNIHLHGEDIGSGIDYFTIYVSEDNGKADFWKSTVDTMVSFAGEDGTFYEFYSVAIDRVGNAEAMKSVPDAFTRIELPQTGIESPGRSSENMMKIVPNPNTGIFKVVLDEYRLQGILEIFDLTGRKIFQVEYLPGEFVNIEQLPKGIYLLNFRSSEGRWFSKLNINK